LTLAELVTAMDTIDSMQGEDSTGEKIDFLAHLFQNCHCEESLRYIVRGCAVKAGLRIGISTKTVENVIHDSVKSEDELAHYEKEVFGYRLRKLTELDSSAIYHIPIKPMLGRPAKNPAHVLETLNKKVDQSRLCADFKYDGERTQIHYCADGKLSLFSRNCDT
jgi:ATP-dependent DNA ligase